MAAPEHLHRKAFCTVNVDGQDVTNILKPYLISVRVIDKSDGFPEAHLELDDRNAELAIPADGTPVSIEMGWDGQGPFLPDTPPFDGGSGAFQLAWESQSPFVFQGFVDSAESGFSRRGGGRRLWIDAKSEIMTGDIKSKQFNSFGDGKSEESLSSVFGQVAGAAGLGGVVSPGLEGVMQKNWHINGSLMGWGRAVANHVGAHLRIANGVAMLIGKGEQWNPTVEAEWGVNLIAWRIKPFVARPQYGQAKMDFFRLTQGSWFDSVKSIAGSLPFGNSSATTQSPGAAPNKQTGDNASGGAGADSTNRRGTGWVMMNGNPNAKFQGRVVIIGARPGVDGTYTIVEAEHNYSRRGYTTRCDLENPQLDVNTYRQFGWRTNIERQIEGGQASELINRMFDPVPQPEDLETRIEQARKALEADPNNEALYQELNTLIIQDAVQEGSGSVQGTSEQQSENAGAGGIQFP